MRVAHRSKSALVWVAERGGTVPCEVSGAGARIADAARGCGQAGKAGVDGGGEVGPGRAGNLHGRVRDVRAHVSRRCACAGLKGDVARAAGRGGGAVAGVRCLSAPPPAGPLRGRAVKNNGASAGCVWWLPVHLSVGDGDPFHLDVRVWNLSDGHAFHFDRNSSPASAWASGCSCSWSPLEPQPRQRADQINNKLKK